jgi:hypothetical protein
LILPLAKINPADGSNTILLNCLNPSFNSIPVECRPTNVVTNNTKAFVANFGVSSENNDIGSQTISVIDIESEQLENPINIGTLAPLKMVVADTDDRLHIIADGFDGEILTIDLSSSDEVIRLLRKEPLSTLRLSPHRQPHLSYLQASSILLLHLLNLFPAVRFSIILRE